MSPPRRAKPRKEKLKSVGLAQFMPKSWHMVPIYPTHVYASISFDSAHTVDSVTACKYIIYIIIVSWVALGCDNDQYGLSMMSVRQCTAIYHAVYDGSLAVYLPCFKQIGSLTARLTHVTTLVHVRISNIEYETVQNILEYCTLIPD